MSNSHSNPFRLHVLGAPDLRAPDGRRVTSVLSQPKRLGLLTYLALAEAPVSRASLVSLFWPESDEPRARNALSQAVFYLRRSLEDEVVQSYSGDRLWVPPELVWCDARERLGANGARLVGGEVGEAEGQVAGELLEGWNADDSHELQEWLDGLRRRLRATERNKAPRPARGGRDRTMDPPSPATFGGQSGGAGSLRRRVRASTLVAAGAAAALAAVLVLAYLSSGRKPVVGEAPLRSLAVLMPQVSATPDAPPIDPGAVHAEILAHLPRLPDLRIVSATYAGSLQDFRRQLLALGVEGDDVPRWILETNIRAARGEARAVGLLHQSPGFDLAGRVSFDVPYSGAEAALLEAPREVARTVADLVERVLKEGR